MSDKPRDQQPDGYGTADEPTTGPPAGAVSASSFDLGATPGRSDPGLGADPDAVPGFSTSPGTGGPAGSSARPDSGTTYGATATPGTSDDAAGASATHGPTATPGTSHDAAGASATYGARDPARSDTTPSSGSRAAPGAGTTSSSGTTSGGGAAPGTGARDATGANPRSGLTGGTKTAGARPAPDAEARKRRKRRLIVAGIAVAAALVVIALCAGGLAVLRAVSGFQDDAAEAREDRRLRDSACLELEGRLNRLVPPGATTTPQARAVAVRDENAATRIYVARLDEQRVSDGWRELLDARTAFAEALDAQVRSRTPAFFVAPAPRDGVSLADQLARWSPGACAGPIRRLSAPDL